MERSQTSLRPITAHDYPCDESYNILVPCIARQGVSDSLLIGTLLGKPLNRVQKTCEDSIRRPQRIEFSQFDLSDNPTAAETR
jgi:hypothetical protein